jgi:hypothetical protein
MASNAAVWGDQQDHKFRPMALQVQRDSNGLVQARFAMDARVIDEVSRTWASVAHHLILWVGLVAVVYLAAPLILEMGAAAIYALAALVGLAGICQSVKRLLRGAMIAGIRQAVEFLLARRWQ